MTDAQGYEIRDADIAWCPGCGNFPIKQSLTLALSELKIKPSRLVIVSGIGQGAKMPQYLNCNMFCGLHGRALPAAAGIKAANPGLTVIAESGDGDMYGEGGNHFIHSMRRNPDITNIVHNNMVYGLTKGQASPTSDFGMKTGLQVEGVCESPLNPVSMAISQNASFVARAFAGDIQETKDMIKAAILHRGYALVDILQPCVTFNRVNTYEWFKKRCYYPKDHDTSDRMRAFELCIEADGIPLGGIYKSGAKKTFNDCLSPYRGGDETPLYERTRLVEDIENILGGEA